MSDKNSFSSRILNKLFGVKNEKEPLVSGKLERSEDFKDQYSQWKDSSVLGSVLGDLQIAYNKSNAFDKYNPAFHVYNSHQANGFFFNTQMRFTEEVYAFLLEYFKDRVLDLGYTIYTSDRKLKDLENGVQQIDRHYLKPALSETEPPIDQKYGNVLIELFSLDEEIQYLKVMVSVYSDRSYKDPKPFLEFMEALFNPTMK